MDAPQLPFVAVSEHRTPSPHLERGQTLVVVAVMIVVLIAFLGLVIDGGNVYAQRRQMQNAADAAALAGARAQVTLGTGATVGVATEYAKANGAGSCAVMATTSTVTANVSETVQTYFIRIIGIDYLPVAASATAAISTPEGLGCGFIPLTIPYQDPSKWPEGEFGIWQKGSVSSTVDIHPSMVGWLNLNGGEVSEPELGCWPCADCTKYPNPGIDLGWVNGSPGTMDAALQEIKRCLEGKTVYLPLYGDSCCWIDKKPACWQSSWDDKPTFGNGSCAYDIVAFAPFHITYVEDSGNPKVIHGYYDKDYIGENCIVVGDGGGKPAGLYWVKLIR